MDKSKELPDQIMVRIQNLQLPAPPADAAIRGEHRRHRISLEDILNPSDDSETESNNSPGTPESMDICERHFSEGMMEEFDYLALAQRDRITATTPESTNDGDASDDVPARGRAFRPAYDPEQLAFIWYLKIDLGICWLHIYLLFWDRWPGARRKWTGLQCVHYRDTQNKGISKVRVRRGAQASASKKDPPASLYGLKKVINERYPWMELSREEFLGI